MKARHLTARQRQVLTFIEDFWNRKGMAPTFQELAEHLGVSSLSTVSEHVENLRSKGFLRPGSNEARDLVPTGGVCPTCGQGLR